MADDLVLLLQPAVTGAEIAVEDEAGVVRESLVFEATLSESHEQAYKVSEHPLEFGAVVADHIVREPFSLQVTVVVSRSPLQARFRENARLEREWLRLLELGDARGVVTVVTSLLVYRNMAIESISAPRSADDGESMNVDITFREVQYAYSVAIQIPPEIVRVLDATSEPPGGINPGTEDSATDPTTAAGQANQSALVSLRDSYAPGFQPGNIAFGLNTP